MKQIGEIYITPNKAIMFKFSTISIEVMASKILKEIKSVIEFDVNGYFVLETNYGEEYYDLKYVLNHLDLSQSVDLESELKSIKSFKIKGEM